MRRTGWLLDSGNHETGSWPSLRGSLQSPSSLRPLLFSMGKSAYRSSTEHDISSPHTFRSPARPIHPYAAVGLRFSPACLGRARDPPRRFPYTSGTPPQQTCVFIRGFVSPPRNKGGHSGHSGLADSRRISPAREHGTYGAGLTGLHTPRVSPRSMPGIRGRASGRYPFIPRLGHAVRRATPPGGTACGFRRPAARTMPSSCRRRPLPSTRCWS